MDGKWGLEMQRPPTSTVRKKLPSFGEDEVDRGWVKSECEVPKQCWRPPDDHVTVKDGGSDWMVPQ